jgi:hypothetical protein
LQDRPGGERRGEERRGQIKRERKESTTRGRRFPRDANDVFGRRVSPEVAPPTKIGIK